MASTPLRQQLSIMRQSLFDEGIVDHKQVSYLETLENEDDPDFIENRDKPVDYPIMERMMYGLKGSSASIGASKINVETNTLRKNFHDGDMESGKASLQKLKAEHANFKEKLVVYVGVILSL
uniref:Histidine-containing phosphotransfer protein n=1 Tax=Salix viminalis TaxID=40686 RepID=A0A6N2LFP6_SALVM